MTWNTRSDLRYIDWSGQVFYLKHSYTLSISAATEPGWSTIPISLSSLNNYFLTITWLLQTSGFQGKSFKSLFSPRGKTSLAFTRSEREREKKTCFAYNKRGEVSETGNVSRLSTHLSIQMSAPLGEHPHIIVQCSGHDPLEAAETDTMGKSLHRRVKPRAIYCRNVSANCPLSPSLRDTGSQTVHKVLF